jgi:hypothetical protein
VVLTYTTTASNIQMSSISSQGYKEGTIGRDRALEMYIEIIPNARRPVVRTHSCAVVSGRLIRLGVD